MSESDPQEDRSDVMELELMIANGTPGRRRAKLTWHKRHRTLTMILKIVMISLACWGLWIFWTHPLIQNAPLPEGVEEGKIWAIGETLDPPHVEAGRLNPGPMYSRGYRWIGTLYWLHKDGSRDTITLPLGESVHIDGLGLITLIGVDPAPIIPENKAGGQSYTINVNLDPGVTLLYQGD